MMVQSREFVFAALCHCCLDKACMGRPTCVSRSNDSLSIAVITESTHCPCVNFFFSFFFFLSFVTRGPLAMLCSTLCSTLFEVFRLVSFFFFFHVDHWLLHQYLLFVVTSSAIHAQWLYISASLHWQMRPRGASNSSCVLHCPKISSCPAGNFVLFWRAWRYCALLKLVLSTVQTACIVRFWYWIVIVFFFPHPLGYVVNWASLPAS